MTPRKQTDILVIGSGIAGASAALKAADAGVDVLLITNVDDLSEGNTAYAQGGIVYKGSDDSPELLAKDILNAGAGKSYKPSARLLARKGPNLVRKLLIKKYGVPFDKNQRGGLDYTMEGAPSSHRILHAEDLTGRAIIDALVNYELKTLKMSI